MSRSIARCVFSDSVFDSLRVHGSGPPWAVRLSTPPARSWHLGITPLVCSIAPTSMDTSRLPRSSTSVRRILSTTTSWYTVHVCSRFRSCSPTLISCDGEDAGRLQRSVRVGRSRVSPRREREIIGGRAQVCGQCPGRTRQRHPRVSRARRYVVEHLFAC